MTWVMLALWLGQPSPNTDATYKNLERDGKITVREHTRDACDRSNDITITSAKGGNVVVKPGETKFFEIDRKDDYTRSGGWYWRCGKSGEKSRIRNATIIKVVRNERGVTDWYWVEERR